MHHQHSATILATMARVVCTITLIKVDHDPRHRSAQPCEDCGDFYSRKTRMREKRISKPLCCWRGSRKPRLPKLANNSCVTNYNTSNTLSVPPSSPRFPRRAQGDLSENAEYDAAKEKQGFVEGRIIELEAKLANAQVIDPTTLDAERPVSCLANRGAGRLGKQPRSSLPNRW